MDDTTVDQGVADRFVLVRLIGRGDWRVYHQLGADDTNPACGAHILHDDWDLMGEEQARASYHRCCKRCKAKEAQGGRANA